MNIIETLEPRRLFDGDQFFTLTSKGTLIVTGTSGNDAISVDLHTKTQVHVLIAPKDSGAFASLSIYHSMQGNLATIKRFVIDGADGNDIISFSIGAQVIRPVTLLGGAGDDRLSYGTGGPVFADGGDGNDIVGGGPSIRITSKKNRDVLDALFAQPAGGVATLLGGNGDDTLGGDTNDSIDGGAGNDVATADTFPSQSEPEDRRDALVHDYYMRIGLSNIETITDVP
jgi:Ca2+-binding RTX toxin-like protein